MCLVGGVVKIRLDDVFYDFDHGWQSQRVLHGARTHDDDT
jgi:hypothetical protein